jgi:hypothetical protein
LFAVSPRVLMTAAIAKSLVAAVILPLGSEDEVDRSVRLLNAPGTPPTWPPELGKKSTKARIKCFAEVEGLIVKYQKGVATGEFLRRIGSVPELQLGDTGTPMVCSFPWRK